MKRRYISLGTRRHVGTFGQGLYIFTQLPVTHQHFESWLRVGTKHINVPNPRLPKLGRTDIRFEVQHPTRIVHLLCGTANLDGKVALARSRLFSIKVGRRCQRITLAASTRPCGTWTEAYLADDIRHCAVDGA